MRLFRKLPKINFMNKTKLLLLAVAVMVVLNLVLLFNTYWKSAEVSSTQVRLIQPDGGSKDLIIERLQFDEGQVVLYEEHIKQHRKHIREKEQEIGNLRRRLFESLADGGEGETSLTGQIGSIQQQIEQIHLDHFKQIRSICRPDQLQYFDNLTSELAHLFASQPPGRQRPIHPRP